MAKALKNDIVEDKESVPGASEEQTPEKILPSSIVAAVDPLQAVVDNITLKFGEVLLVSLDGNGQETGMPFKVSTGTYATYYSDENKYRLKKNHE